MSNQANGHPVGGAPACGHQRRHSSAGIFSLAPQDRRTPAGEVMIHAKKDHTMNPPAVSDAFDGEDGYLRLRSSNGLPDIRDSDDPAEEKIRLVQDVKRLDTDVLDGLIAFYQP